MYSFIDKKGIQREFRKGVQYYDNQRQYYIERKIGDGKWKLIIGGLPSSTIDDILNNNLEEIDTHWKREGIKFLLYIGALLIIFGVAYLFQI